MKITKKRVQDAIEVINFFGTLKYVDSSKIEDQRIGELTKHLETLKDLYNDNGSVNVDNPFAEKQALCFARNGNHKEALKIFDALAGGSTSLLFLHSPPERGVYYSEGTANTAGKLGYRGLYEYGISCLEIGLKSEAINLLTELVGKIPDKCPPYTLSDYRLYAAEELIKLGVTSIGGRDIKEILAESKKHNP